MVCSANVKIAETYAYAKFCINGQFAAKFLVITLFIVNLLLTGNPDVKIETAIWRYSPSFVFCT